MRRNYKSGIISNNTISYNKITNSKTATPLIINNTTGEVIKNKSFESTTPTSRGSRNSSNHSKSPKIKSQLSSEYNDDYSSDYEYY